MRAQTVIFGFAMVLAVSAHAPEKSSDGKFRGTVTDSSGAVISNAIVLVHRDWPQADIQDLRLTTDQVGGFSIDLVPGFYDVAIFAHAFSPSVGKVRIKTSQTKNYTAQLPPDPQMIAEFGDSFVENPKPAESPPKPKP